MANKVTIINSTEGVSSDILCYSITYNWNNLAQDFEIPGSSTIQPVQFNGWKNPAFTLNFTIDLGGIIGGTLTWANWNKIVKSSSNSTLQVVLTDSNLSFGSYANSSTITTDISFRVVSYSVSINPSDNRNSNLIDIQAQCIECKI